MADKDRDLTDGFRDESGIDWVRPEKPMSAGPLNRYIKPVLGDHHQIRWKDLTRRLPVYESAGYRALEGQHT
ncbi:hypothetical protein GCM10009717_19730 [Agromyces allii]|uniref:Uncharacterized protein n=1 Tax=Agromyces allii TaxID=393607 RepID=A0ABN2QK46_9MICO|nr:hypothetical protein [Agromyces allii]